MGVAPAVLTRTGPLCLTTTHTPARPRLVPVTNNHEDLDLKGDHCRSGHWLAQVTPCRKDAVMVLRGRRERARSPARNGVAESCAMQNECMWHRGRRGCATPMPTRLLKSEQDLRIYSVSTASGVWSFVLAVEMVRHVAGEPLLVLRRSQIDREPRYAHKRSKVFASAHSCQGSGPGPGPGCSWHPSVFSPSTKYYYVCTVRTVLGH